MSAAAMKWMTLITVALSFNAFADPFPSDAPIAVDVRSGVIGVGEAVNDYETFEITGGRYFNPAGVEKLDKILADMQTETVALTVENEALRRDNTRLALEPAFTLGNGLLIFGGGLVIGVAATLTVFFLAR